VGILRQTFGGNLIIPVDNAVRFALHRRLDVLSRNHDSRLHRSQIECATNYWREVIVRQNAANGSESSFAHSQASRRTISVVSKVKL
jgi:hypothetical protein